MKTFNLSLNMDNDLIKNLKHIIEKIEKNAVKVKISDLKNRVISENIRLENQCGVIISSKMCQWKYEIIEE